MESFPENYGNVNGQLLALLNNVLGGWAKLEDPQGRGKTQVAEIICELVEGEAKKGEWTDEQMSIFISELEETFISAAKGETQDSGKVTYETIYQAVKGQKPKEEARCLSLGSGHGVEFSNEV
jgi:hypothetical protein